VGAVGRLEENMLSDWIVKRILVKQDQRTGTWIAQCVDFDLVAQAKTKEGLFKAFGHVYYGEILVALENHRLPLFGKPPVSAQIEWANITERSTTAAKKVSWSEFIPDWVPAAFGKLAEKYGLAKKESVEIQVPAGAAA
jgi:hypothetical protein